MLKNLLLIFVLICSFCSNSLAIGDKIDHWKRGIVSITNQVVKSPYNHIGEFYGSGFIIDKERGIIATNKHVVSCNNINHTIVTLYNGRQLEAQLLYSDPLSDFSFLKITSLDVMGSDTVALPLINTLPQVNETVTIIGNNEAQGFSIQTGIVTSLFEVSNHFPDQTIRISLNTRGGSSGSPIIDQKGNVVAINYATDNTYAYALPASYLNDAYQSIKQATMPTRQDTGAIFSYYSLDKAVRDLNFPEAEVATYLKKFPNSLNKALIVSTVLSRTPAESIIRPADIIWQVNSKQVGPNLYDLQAMINQSNKEIKFSVYRNGKVIDLVMPVYKPKDNQIKRMISLDNAILFEVDDYINFLTGAPIGSVFIVNVERSSGLANINTIFIDGSPTYFLQVNYINDKPIKSLDDIINLLPELRSKPEYVIYYRNYSGQGGYDKTMYFNRSIQFKDVRFSPYDEPLLYTLDEKTNIWTTKKL